jgi:hypothetical protein
MIWSQTAARVVASLSVRDRHGLCGPLQETLAAAAVEAAT